MGRRISSSDVTAIAATVTAVAALVVALWDNIQQREFNRLSVLPHVNTAFVLEGMDRGRLLVSNHGVGPAILRSIRIAACGHDRTFDSWSEAQAQLEEFGVDVIGVYDFNPGEALGTGQSITALTFVAEPAGTDGSAEAVRASLTDLMGGIALELSYESIYGESFTRVRNPSCLPGPDGSVGSPS